jgi:predicted transcriptional regulator YheO
MGLFIDLLEDLLERPRINDIHSFMWMNKATDEEIEKIHEEDNSDKHLTSFFKDVDRDILYRSLIIGLESIKMVCINNDVDCLLNYDIGFELNKIYDVNMTRNKNSFYLMDNAHHFHQIENNSKYLITLSEFREKRINKILE